LNPVAWHLHIYSPAADTSTSAGPLLIVGGLPLATRIVDSGTWTSRFAITFEQALDQLQPLDRMFIELDGSFVWRDQWPDASKVLKANWQLDGMIYDQAGRIQRLEVKGDAPLAVWEELFAVFGWPQQPLLAQLVDHQSWIDLNDLVCAMRTLV
jgi:hypothetical protein